MKGRKWFLLIKSIKNRYDEQRKRLIKKTEQQKEEDNLCKEKK